MNVAIQNRKILLVGVAVVALAAVLLVVRPLLLGSSDDSVTAVPAPASSLPTSPSTPSKDRTPAKPRVLLLPGLPGPVVKGLNAKSVVVVAMSVGGSPGAAVQLGQARKGARAVGAGFVSVDLAREGLARQMMAFAGTDSNDRVIVVKRPGKIVNRFSSYVDSAIVAQAAVDAGLQPVGSKSKAKSKATAATKRKNA
jgi:hypothetical protein